MTTGTILFIDAYDSFSNNITALLQQELGVRTERIRIDDARFVLNDDAFQQFVQRFDAVVAGPGPGHPQIQQDVGLIARLWTLPDLVPVLGICLGFQSLCVANGAAISRLHQPRHGLVTRISHQATSIFAGVGDLYATQYHSLQVSHEIAATSRQLNDNLLPLAWDLTDSENGPILMAVQHAKKPFVGVQFHPESICTNAQGARLIRNWWQYACSWNVENRQLLQGSPVVATKSLPTALPQCNLLVEYQQVDIATHVTIVDVAKLFMGPYTPIILQSGTRHGRPLNPETGRYSILGLHDAKSIHVRYTCSDQTLHVVSDQQALSTQKMSIRNAFEFLKTFINEHKADEGAPSIPFWGGLIGYVSYEAGLSSIDVVPPTGSDVRPDMWFVFVERSIVLDHTTGSAYVQSIRSGDTTWIRQATSLLARVGVPHCNGALSTPGAATLLSQPQREQYERKVVDCQAHLRAGSSYELCLTDQTAVRSSEDPWQIYNRLSKLNPAPFGAYLNFMDSIDANIGVVFAGSSPERFLSWTRQGKCQFRPIKGTVLKDSNTSRATAEAILRSQKEVAENLMIVDLIRHDLAGVEGVQNVRVPNLMVVEEYETVYQLVSVIEGDLVSGSGVSVLAASLPPGSMTGAPKRRSCELLKDLEEGQPRGLYSGVVGYLDVGGGGDFSVVIRSAFKWNDEDHWRIGAGGAVTVLSTPEGEYEEMLVKRQRLLDVLLHDS